MKPPYPILVSQDLAAYMSWQDGLIDTQLFQRVGQLISTRIELTIGNMF